MIYPDQKARWRKYIVTYTQLSTAGVTNDITLFSLPAKGIIHGTIIVPTTAFSGGLIATYTLSVGITGNLVKYCTAINSFTGFSLSQPQAVVGVESVSAATDIKVAAISTVGNLNAATAGSADIYVLWSRLP